MSADSLCKFLASVAESEDLQAAWEVAGTSARRVELGAEHGFAFTEDELDVGLDVLRQRRSAELGEEQLEQVAGGLSFLGNWDTYGFDGKGNDVMTEEMLHAINRRLGKKA